MTSRRFRWVTGLWLALMVLALAVIARTPLIADLSAFMPGAPSARQQLLVDQFHDGIVGRILMIGIAGGEAPPRAELSRQLAARLRASGLFAGVQNGDPATRRRDAAYFFDNRYRLSPAITPEHFTAPLLHRAIIESLDRLAGDGGLLLKRGFSRDPSGEALQLLDRAAGESSPRVLDGAWASRDGQRAVLIAYTKAPGADTEAQARAITRVREAFAALASSCPGCRLELSGTSVFSVDARNTIESRASRLAGASLVLVFGLLLVIYRSPRLLLLGFLPVLSGAVVGLATVSLVFGRVHSLTLGFGTALIGEAVDYSIYFFLQRTGHLTATPFWRTIWLGVATSIAGFSALLFSGFPGLAQLGTYSISGLITAALVTRYGFPEWVPARVTIRPLESLSQVLDRLFDQAGRLGWVSLLAMGLSGWVILDHGSTFWNQNLSSLSPVSSDNQRIDQQLRQDLGAPDLRYLVALSAANAEQALEAAEGVEPVLDRWVAKHRLSDYDSPARVLPSQSLQRQRQQAIPPPEAMRRRLAEALLGLPVNIGRLSGFLTDIEATRTGDAVQRPALDGTSASLLVDSLLIARKRDWLVLLPLRPPQQPGAIVDIGRLQTDLDGLSGPRAVVIDVLQESTELFANYRQAVLVLAGWGCLVIVGLLSLALRSTRRVLRVILPLAAAVLCTTALHLAVGVSLTLLHLVGLLLVVAIGSNYALFFEGAGVKGGGATRRRMQVSLVIANLTAVASFGVLGLSGIPVLAAIGTTVSLGTLLSLLFAATLSRRNGLQLRP